jgi:arylsulfatase A-like enzyme
MDHGIGEVLEALDDLGQRKNTIVVFTSDNGGALQFGANNGSLRSGKGHIYEGGLKVPTCIRWPGHIEAGRTTDFRALTMDIIPTLADLCGVPINHEIEGRVFTQLLLTNKTSGFNRPNFHMWLQKTTKETMIDGDWKLVRDEAGKAYELFSLKDDPNETTDLAAKEPERLQKMSEALEAHMAEAQLVPWRKPKS